MISFLSLTLFASLFYTAGCTLSKSNSFDLDSIRYVYAFGDSYTFIQGTAGHPNYSFIGDALEPAFTPAELLSSKIVPRNTSSEGSNWLEFLTGCFQGFPAECETQLWDFAFAGADIDAALLPRHDNYTLPLVEQVEQWAQYASDVVLHPENETLTAWWIGINDINDSALNSSIPDFHVFWEKEMSSYFKAVQFAHDTGLKTHLFLNVPAFDRAPLWNSKPDASKVRSHINLFNEVLGEHMARFGEENPDANILFFDANVWFDNILDTASQFGFTNVTGFDSSPYPHGYFWHDLGHPTEAVHKLLAEGIRTQLQGQKL